MLVFGILAVAALTIDLGLVILAQDQMQTATDGAALEGVRWKDEVDDDQRRQIAAAMIGVIFDDDLSPDPLAPDPYGLGAGPIIGVVGGLPQSNGAAQIVLDQPTVYKPNAEGTPIQLNQGNLVHGDLVSGVYFDVVGGEPVAHVEAADYVRDDFLPEDTGDAFLARMRRTRNALSLDQEPGISSSAPPLPLLFGLGALVSAPAGAEYNPREDGITTRATSIAAPKRALRIASPAAQPLAARVGALPLVPIAIRLSRWETLAVGVEETLAAAEFVRAVELDPTQDTTDRVDVVGESVTAAPPGAVPAIPNAIEVVTPVIADVDGDGIDQVIGFGVVIVTALSADNATVIKRGGRLPRSGTEARDPFALRELAADPALFAAHQAMSEPVLAAVLVR